LEHPGTPYKGWEIAALRGRSWLEFLSTIISADAGFPEANPRIHDDNYAVGFEIAGSGAMHRGNWKITFVPAPQGPQRWELFNTKPNPRKTNDLSDEYL
jgi:hypothetical protein